jgi:hypothetical protein
MPVDFQLAQAHRQSLPHQRIERFGVQQPSLSMRLAIAAISTSRPELTANHQVTGFRVLSGYAKSFLLLTGEPLFGISLRDVWPMPSIPNKA